MTATFRNSRARSAAVVNRARTPRRNRCLSKAVPGGAKKKLTPQQFEVVLQRRHRAAVPERLLGQSIEPESTSTSRRGSAVQLRRQVSTRARAAGASRSRSSLRASRGKQDLSWASRARRPPTQGGSHLGHVFDDGPKPEGLRTASTPPRFGSSRRTSRIRATGKCRALRQPAKSGLAGESPTRTEVATLAGGCFWGMEDILKNFGVISTRVGQAPAARFPIRSTAMRTGATGHAELVR